jgi:hypothetical protein
VTFAEQVFKPGTSYLENDDDSVDGKEIFARILRIGAAISLVGLCVGLLSNTNTPKSK